MRQSMVLLVILGLLLTAGSVGLAKRDKGGQSPVGEGEWLNWNSVEYIDQDELCWIRVGAYGPVYPHSIPDVKEEFGIRNLANGIARVEIYIDGIQLHSEIKRSIVWRSDCTYPGSWLPDEFDCKYTWYFVQLPGGYFASGVHYVTMVGSYPNPNGLYTQTVVWEITVHVG